MMTESGRVVAIDGDSVWVETLRQSSCNACSARSGCGHGILNTAKPGASRALIQARLPDRHDSGNEVGRGNNAAGKEKELKLSLHDEVDIALPETHFLSGIALLYGVPLLMALGGAFVGEWMLDGSPSQATADLSVALGALAGLLSGVCAVRLISDRFARACDLVPMVVAARRTPEEKRGSQRQMAL